MERPEKELLEVFSAVSSELQPHSKERTDLLPIVQSVLNNAFSPQRAGVSPIKSLTKIDATGPTSSFYCSTMAAPVPVYDVLR